MSRPHPSHVDVDVAHVHVHAGDGVTLRCRATPGCAIGLPEAPRVGYLRAVTRERATSEGVSLPTGHTGSSFLHRLLSDAVEAFPEALSAAALPADPKAFKRDYGEVLVRFEAARAASEQRVEIARLLTRRTAELLVHAGDAGQVPLATHLRTRAALPGLRSEPATLAPGLVPEVPFEGRVHRGPEVIELCEQLVARHHMTDAALSAARYIVGRAQASGGKLDLRGERFVLLGAGAELAPTPLLLRAGASVLWVDLSEPGTRVTEGDRGGELWRSDAVTDLLRAPREVAATVARFAQDGPVHIGMFAYAGGASREFRLGAAMNAIVASLDPGSVRSIALLVSPTMPANVQPQDAAAAEAKLEKRPLWQSAFKAIGLLPTPGRLTTDGACVSRSIVSIQGVSYQAAQYVGKIAAAESFAVHGIDPASEKRRPVTVSANVAGITNTRSLAHPLFQAAFVGAPKFDVCIYEPATTRALSALLVLADLLNPAAPGAAGVQPASPKQKAEGLLSQQVHGGIYSLPYALEPAIRVSAVLGMGMRPSVLFGR